MKGGREPRNVLVAGAGAIGQFLGARLQQGGHLVTLLVRPQHAEAIRTKGLTIHGASSLSGHVDCITDVAAARTRFDAIVLTCKAHATAALATQVAPLLDREGILVSLQNGFGNGAKAAKAVAPARVAVAITSQGVLLESPGRLLHAGDGPTTVGPHVPEGAAASGLAHTLLSDAGLSPQSRADMRPFIWRKAIVNHAVNPVGATLGAANGRLLEGRAWMEVQELAEEGYALARAAGVALPEAGGPATLTRAIRDTLERTPGNRNSMLQDVTAHKPTEIEQITGRLVRLARRLGHPAVRSEEVYRRIKDMEAAYLGEDAVLRMARDESEWESQPF